MKLKQVVIAQWSTQAQPHVVCYSIFGLSTTGILYRLVKGAGGWKKMPTDELTKAELDVYYREGGR